MGIYLRLNKLRTELKESKAAFSKRLSIDNSQYGKVEKGKMHLTLNQIMELCSTLDVSSDWLLFGIGKPFRNTNTNNVQIANGNNNHQTISQVRHDNALLHQEIDALKRENELLREMVDLLKKK